ncbi:MAG: hypothetical protein LBD01_04530 [Puniceicoccales bacterium]|jgi:hypothetical protein|nr:hypothetical protein [Puniceicoccales bacterium]
MTNKYNKNTNAIRCLKMFFCIFALCLFPALGIAGPKPLSLPAPLVALKESGQYHEHLLEMQEQLKKGDMICFYALAQEFIDKVDGNRTLRRIEKRPVYIKEDGIAWTWYNYYLSIAPLIPFEQLEKGRIPKHDRYELDIDRKCGALANLINTKTEQEAEHCGCPALSVISFQASEAGASIGPG